MVKASVRSLTSSSSFIAKAAFFTASGSVEHSRGERRGQWEIKMDPLGDVKWTHWGKDESIQQMVVG